MKTDSFLRGFYMPQQKKWTLEAVKAEAAKYDSHGGFQAGSPSAYHAAWRNGWLKQLNLIKRREPPKWTFEAVKTEAAKYASRGDFRVGSRSAYVIAHRKGWLESLFPTT